MNRAFQISAMMLVVLVGGSVLYAIWYVESHDVQQLGIDDDLCDEGMTSVIIGFDEDTNTLNKKCEIIKLQTIYNKNNPTLESTILVGLASSSIVGIGIFLYTTLGYLKARHEFENSNSGLTEEKKKEHLPYDIHKLLKSISVGVISGLILVMPQVQNMTLVPSVENVILSLTLISTVAGLDAIAKKASLPKNLQNKK